HVFEHVRAVDHQRYVDDEGHAARDDVAHAVGVEQLGLVVGQRKQRAPFGVDGVKAAVVGQAQAAGLGQCAQSRAGERFAVGDQVDAHLDIDAGAEFVHVGGVGQCGRAQREVGGNREELVGNALDAVCEAAE